MMEEGRAAGPAAGRHWDEAYGRRERLWGDEPSEIGVLAAELLAQWSLPGGARRLLDIGCGYGRDARYLHERLGIEVLGIDHSAEGIALAGELSVGIPRVRFACRSFTDPGSWGAGEYGAVLAAQVYHVLRPGDRRLLRDTVARVLAPGGYLFLGTLSVRDPEHHGKGEPVPGEEASFVDKVYLHLSTRTELEREFGFLRLLRLEEHEFDEPRTDGAVHHHVEWLLVAQKAAPGA
jgi:SAM-dependent methyltransferase